MVLVAALRDYVLRMLNDVPGVKVLILDEETVRDRTNSKGCLRQPDILGPAFPHSLPTTVFPVAWELD